MKFKKILAVAMAFTMLMPNIVMADDGKITVYIAGDSTACEYGTDDNYALPRAGWGMYLDDYMNDDVEVKDLAKSGRSSKSLTTEDEYKQIFDNIKEGDYLLVQFGHNDAKNSSDEDKELRYTDPEGDKDTEGSFKNSLYVNYIKPAQEKGATVILLTPISRRKFSEDGKVTDSHGLYDDDVRELAEELNLPCIDLTEKTAELYNQAGEEGSKIYHAIFKDATKGEDGFDNTHLNHYGAKYVAMCLSVDLMNVDETLESRIYACVKDKLVTRGEFTAQLVRLLGIEAEAKDNFTDVSSDDENYNAIAVAKACGIVNGNENGEFNANSVLSFQDMAVITARALEYVNALEIKENGKAYGYYTADGVKAYAVPAIDSLLADGVLNEDDLTSATSGLLADKTAYVLKNAYEAKTTADKVSSEGEMSLDELEKVE